MNQVRLSAAWKNSVHDDRVAQCDATAQKTPHVLSYSPDRKTGFLKTLKNDDIQNAQTVIMAKELKFPSIYSVERIR